MKRKTSRQVVVSVSIAVVLLTMSLLGLKLSGCGDRGDRSDSRRVTVETPVVKDASATDTVRVNTNSISRKRRAEGSKTKSKESGSNEKTRMHLDEPVN